MYTQVRCLKSYYSPLDRSKVLHIEGSCYQAFKAKADGFYAVNCEKYEGQPFERVVLQVHDTDYLFQ